MPATFHDLSGASVFITGGGSGIGAALTEGFLAQGARVAFVGRSDYAGFAADLGRKHGAAPLFIRCDVTRTEDLHAAMDRAAEVHGPISVLVNNAANDQRMPADSVSPADWNDQIAINFSHYFFAAQKGAAMMRARGGGSIVNYTSISYMMGHGDMAPYVASNAGITGLTRALAREWGPDGIRVNAIAPGWVLTDKQLEKWASPEKLEAHKAKQCLKRMMQPEDMVAPTLFLASEASAMMTGQVMPVDAGVVVTG